MSLHPLILTIILVNCILTSVGWEFSLKGNETGRYLYKSDTNPASMFYCTYCPDDLSSQDEIDRNQEEKCATLDRLKFYQNDAEENQNKLYPFCKQAVGKIPGCGPIPFKEGLVFKSKNSGFLRINDSRVYEVYSAKCVDKGYSLSSNTTVYRCGENRMWDSNPYQIECLPQSDTDSHDQENSTYPSTADTVPLDNENRKYIDIMIGLSIAGTAVLMIIGFTAIRNRKLIMKSWHHCHDSKKSSNSIELPPVSQSSDSVEKNEETEGTCLTENVANDATMYSETSTREEEKKEKSCLSSKSQEIQRSNLKVHPCQKFSVQGQSYCYELLEERGEPDGIDAGKNIHLNRATNIEHTETIEPEENDEEFGSTNLSQERIIQV